MNDDKVKEFFQQMDTWRFIALVLLGVTVGIFLTADRVIDDMVESVNNCRYENYKLQYPQATQQSGLNQEYVNKLLNFSKEVIE